MVSGVSVDNTGSNLVIMGYKFATVSQVKVNGVNAPIVSKYRKTIVVTPAVSQPWAEIELTHTGGEKTIWNMF